MQSIKLEYCVTIATLLLVTSHLLLGQHYHCPLLTITADHMAATQPPRPLASSIALLYIILYCYPDICNIHIIFLLAPSLFPHIIHHSAYRVYHQNMQHSS